MLIREPAFGRIANGRLSPPTAPGTGLNLDDKALAKSARRSGRVTM